MKIRLSALCAAVCVLFMFCAVVAAAELNLTQFFITTDHAEGTFYVYDEDGKRTKVDVGKDALIVNIEAVNCEDNDVYSGIIELYYDAEVLRCIGANSETGGFWIVNTLIPGKVRLVFSTGAHQTEDGVLLSAAFEYIEEPELGEETEFSLGVEQLCSARTGSGKYVEYEVPEDDYTYEYKPPEYYLYGDANGDGKVTTADAVAVLKHSAEMAFLTDERFIQGDVNFDGDVTTSDAVLVLRYCVNIITSFEH